MRLCVFLCLPVWLAVHGVTSSAAESKRHAVIAAVATGVFERGGGENRLFPAEVVAVLGQFGDKVLVKRLGEQPSFETRSRVENERAKAATWVPASLLREPKTFRKLASWRGETQFISCAASCDSGTDFVFSRDASFRAVYSAGNSSDSPKPVKWSGHLYRSGDLLWARPKRKNAQPEPDSVFHVRPDGTLCTPVECFGNL